MEESGAFFLLPELSVAAVALALALAIDQGVGFDAAGSRDVGFGLGGRPWGNLNQPWMSPVAFKSSNSW